MNTDLYISKLQRMSNDKLLQEYLDMSSMSSENSPIDELVSQMTKECKKEVLRRMINN